MKKLIPFDIAKAKAGANVETRNGHKVRITCFDMDNNDFPIIALIIRIFVPTNKELMAIYGIGGTIDYIKSDSVATNLPSKAIKAIDLWLDEKTNDD